MHAIVSSPAHGIYGVLFYHHIDEYPGRQDHSKPSFFLPCGDYSHANEVANAFNEDKL